MLRTVTDASGGEPDEAALQRRWLASRLLRLACSAVVLVAVVIAVPGLGSLRARFAHAEPGWAALAGACEGASVLAFGIALHRAFRPWLRRTGSALLAAAAQAINALIPTGGASGPAAISIVLARAGLPRRLVVGRMVALFVMTDALTNVALLSVGGLGVALGWLSARGSAAAAAIPGAAGAMLLVLLAIVLRRRLRDPLLLGGSIAYVLLDLAALISSFRAVGSAHLPLGTLLLGYTVGQVGSAIPLPGTAEGGLLGAFVLYGAGVSVTLTAILVYRAAQTLVPLALGAGGAIAGRAMLFGDPGSMLACVSPADQRSG